MLPYIIVMRLPDNNQDFPIIINYLNLPLCRSSGERPASARLVRAKTSRLTPAVHSVVPRMTEL